MVLPICPSSSGLSILAVSQYIHIVHLRLKRHEVTSLVGPKKIQNLKACIAVVILVASNKRYCVVFAYICRKAEECQAALSIFRQRLHF